MALGLASVTSKQVFVWLVTVICGAYHLGSVTGCGAAYEQAIDYFCLAKFRLDMQALDQHRWCSWKDTIELYGELTNCTYIVALKMDCFWPNRQVDIFSSKSTRSTSRTVPDRPAAAGPPNSILGPFILVPVLVTLLMTALVVWRSKRSEGIV